MALFSLRIHSAHLRRGYHGSKHIVRTVAACESLSSLISAGRMFASLSRAAIGVVQYIGRIARTPL
jgi:hypothetical protein